MCLGLDLASVIEESKKKPAKWGQNQPYWSSSGQASYWSRRVSYWSRFSDKDIPRLGIVIGANAVVITKKPAIWCMHWPNLRVFYNLQVTLV